MGVCGENTRHQLTWCVLPEDHEGGHRGVMNGKNVHGRDELMALAWSEENADPIVIESGY